MAPQMSRAEAITTAHANIDALLSQKSTCNDVFPEQVTEIAKQLFECVFDARVEIFRQTVPRPKAGLLIAAIIHAACRQCDGQSRTFNEIARLTGEKVWQIDKIFRLIDEWLCSMNYPAVKEEVEDDVEVKEKMGELKEDMEVKEEIKEEWDKKALPLPYRQGARASANILAARWSANLELDSKAIKLAFDLAGRTEGWTSRSPANIAGAAIYAVSKLLRTRLPLKTISNASCAPVGSLMSAYKEICENKERYMPTQWQMENKLTLASLTPT